MALEGWTECGRGGDGTGAQPAPIAIPPREPPGCELAPAAIATKQEKRAEAFQRVWEAETRLNEQAWDSRGSYPTMPNAVDVPGLVDYSKIPEQR